MLALVINAGNVSDNPLLELSHSHYRLTFRVILTAFGRGRKSSAGQRMDLFVESAQQSFNVGAVVRRLHRTPFKIDAVFLTSALQHVPAKLSAIISVDALHHAPARPTGRMAQPGQPLLLWQDRMRDAQTNRHTVRWVQRDENADHHPAEDIDRQSYPRPTDTQSMNVVDQHDVELRVIDLNHSQRPVGSWEMTEKGSVLFIGNFSAQPFLVPFLFRDSKNAIANGKVMRRFEVRVCEASFYLIIRLLDGALLPVQVNLFHQTTDDRFYFRRQPALSLAAVGLCRSEIRNPAALLVKRNLAINRCRMYAGFLNHSSGVVQSFCSIKARSLVAVLSGTESCIGGAMSQSFNSRLLPVSRSLARRASRLR